MVSKLSDVELENWEEDKLGFKDYAEGVIAIIERISEEDTPFSIGIFGSWGSGKTSFMKIMKDLLESESRGYKDHTIFFNSWEYGNEDKPWIPFMIKIVDTLFEDKIVKNELLRNIFIFSTNVVLQTYSHEKISTGGILDLFEKSRETGPFKEWSNKDTKTIIERVKKIDEFKETLKSRAKKLPKGKIIIFIDDLDRIQEKSIDFLNSMKIFLNIKGCIFIIGCDYNILDSALKKKYNEQDYFYENYFDKIVQAQFYIPRISEQAITEYLQFLTGSEKDVKDCTQLVIHSIGGNPRKIKRVVNATKLIKSVFERKVDSILQAFEIHKPETRIEHEETEKDEMDVNVVLKSKIRGSFTPAEVFHSLFDEKVLFKLMCMREQWLRLYERILSEEMIQKDLISLQNPYLFSWDEIPGKDDSKLIEFLRVNFDIVWAETVKINKIDGGKTINLSSGSNSVSLRLNDEKTKINITINDVRTDEFIAKMENGKLNIFVDITKLLEATKVEREKLKETEKNLPVFLEDSPKFHGIEDIKTYLTLLEISSPEAGILLHYAEPEKLPIKIFSRYIMFEHINKRKVEEEDIKKKIKKMDWKSGLSSYYFFIEVLIALGYDDLIKDLFEDEKKFEKFLKQIKDADPEEVLVQLTRLRAIDEEIAKEILDNTKHIIEGKIIASVDPLAISSMLNSVRAIDEEIAKEILEKTKHIIEEKIIASVDPLAISSMLNSVRAIDEKIAKELLNKTTSAIREKIPDNDCRQIIWLFDIVRDRQGDYDKIIRK